MKNIKNIRKTTNRENAYLERVLQLLIHCSSSSSRSEKSKAEDGHLKITDLEFQTKNFKKIRKGKGKKKKKGERVKKRR